MITNHIKDLLLAQKRVSIPGLGTLIIKDKSSRMEKGGELFTPPTSVIEFEEHIAPDELDDLIEFIVAKEGISVESAEEQVKSFAGMVHQSVMEENNTVPLEDLGAFQKGLYDNLIFEPSQEEQVPGEGFGLPNLEASPLNLEDGLFEEDHPDATEQRKNMLIWLVAIPVAFVLVFGTYLFFNEKALEAFNPFAKEEVVAEQVKEVQEDAEKAVEKEEEKKTEESTPTNDEVHPEEEDVKEKEVPLSEEDNEKNIVEKKKEEKNDSNELVVSSPSGKYFLVVASLPSVSSAEKMVKKMNGQGYPNAVVIKSGNKIRVAVDSFVDKKVAEKKKKTYRSAYSDVWTLKY